VRELVVVVDMANVVGSRPDGWWRDRAGAATRLLAALVTLPGREVSAPGGDAAAVARVVAVVAVVEGAARAATDPVDAPALSVVRAVADGDAAIAEAAATAVAASRAQASTQDTGADGAPRPRPGVVVVTADRGLRARLPATAVTAGPRWLLDALDDVRR
jgi:hypothetical protein